MTRLTRRSALAGFGLVVVLGVIGLLLAGSADERPNSFYLNVAPTGVVALVHQGQIACEGPIPVPITSGAIKTFLAVANPPSGGVRLTIRDVGSSRVLATGEARSPYAGDTDASPVAELSTPIPAGRTISVCFRTLGSQRINLVGSGSLSAETLRFAGRTSPVVAALTFLRPRPKSVLSLIPTIFRRASLFRPTWVGAWTFWVLLVGLLATFALAGWAIAQAAREDSDSSERTAAQ
jgi:hypothetical protein